MLSFGWQELIVVAFVLVLVVGPKDMPRVLRAISNGMAYMRTLANEFRTAMLDAANQQEVKDAKRILDDALDETKGDVKSTVTNALGDDVAETLGEAGKIAGEIKGKSNKMAGAIKTKPSKPRQDNAKPAGKSKTRRSA